MEKEDLLSFELDNEKRLLEIEGQLEIISKDLQGLKASVKDLVSAWQAASWVISIVKGLGALAVAIATIYTLFTGKH